MLMKRKFNYYDFCSKHKWFDWLDDHIFYYIFRMSYNKYRSLRHWFHCNWNLAHWKTVKSAITGYPWDGSFMWELEECKIDEAINYFSSNKHWVGDERYNKLMSTLKLAKYLVHIVATEGTELSECSGELSFVPIKEGSELMSIEEGSFKCWYTGPYVNKRTAHKYIGKDNVEWYTRDENLHELYFLKAKHLYCKIRKEYTGLWWD